MNQCEVSGKTNVTVAAPEEAGEPEGPDLHSGLFNLNTEVMALEA